MNYFETQKYFKEIYPDNLVTFSFDDNCIRQLECIMTNGLPNLHHHLEFDKVRVVVENVLDKYIPITTHRMTTTWVEFKKIISSKNEVFIHEDSKKLFCELNNNPETKLEYDQVINEFCIMSGMTKDQIEKSLS